MRTGWDIKVIRNDGLVLSYETEDLAVISVEGVDFPSIEVFKEPRAFGHGDIISGIRKNSREIKVVAAIRYFDYYTYGNIRKNIMAFHNANYRYKLVITYMGVTRIAKNCCIAEANYPTERYRVNPQLTITYISSEADLFANSTDTTSFISRRPIWHDTRVYKGSNGRLAFGEIVKTTDKVINYLGSEPTPIKVIITADGYVNGINVTLGENKLTVNETLNKGDVLIVDGVKRVVTKNNQLIPFSKYDANILFRLNLEYGDNTVKVDSGDNMAFTANVEYEGRYGGI